MTRREPFVHSVSSILQSEERGKDDNSKERSLRPAGSSPCVVVEGSFNVRDQVADPEQGIYHGFYRLGTWICITDKDVWRRHEFVLQDGKRTHAPRAEKINRRAFDYFQNVPETSPTVAHRPNRRETSAKSTRRSPIASFTASRASKCTGDRAATRSVSISICRFRPATAFQLSFERCRR